MDIFVADVDILNPAIVVPLNVPHDVVTTNSTGYYSITGLPGNDTLVFSTGSVSSNTLTGPNVINTQLQTHWSDILIRILYIRGISRYI